MARAGSGALALGGLALWLGFTFFLYRLSTSDGWQARAQALLRGELLQMPLLARASVALGTAQAAIETRYAQTAPRPRRKPAPAAAPVAPSPPPVVATGPAPSSPPATTGPAAPGAAQRTSEPTRTASAPAAPVREAAAQAGAERALPGCEAFEGRQGQLLDFAAPRAPAAGQTLQRALQARLEQGSYFAHCGLPASTALTICAAVEQGRAVGVSVATEPHQPVAERCVRRAVQGLRFPASPELEVYRTRFAGKP